MKRPCAAVVLLFVLAWTGRAFAQSERLSDAQMAGVVFVANQAEIAAGEAALRRTRSRSLQAFASRVVAEHGQVNQEIVALTQRLSATLQPSQASDALTREANDDLGRLDETDSYSFDRAYLDREVDYLGRLVSTTETFIRTTNNADFKVLLVRARPSFILHLDQARRLKLAIGSRELGR